MLIFTQKVALSNHLKFNANQNTVGFVPTMGALHQGHLSLLEASIAENNITVISIFVNPTQFNNATDLEKYPRTLENDILKIKTISDEIIVFAPEISEIYGTEMLKEHFDFDGLENQMEGNHRPGHFDGVGTVVKKLFSIVNPTTAYFGEKDFQQVQIIKKLVEKQNLAVQIVQIPIFREKNGLAMSSRNERLSKVDREKAAIIYQTLLEVKNRFKTDTITDLQKWVKLIIEQEHKFTLEYFEIADEATLISAVNKSENQRYRAFIAVFVDDVRLIDTIAL